MTTTRPGRAVITTGTPDLRHGQARLRQPGAPPPRAGPLPRGAWAAPPAPDDTKPTSAGAALRVPHAGCEDERLAHSDSGFSSQWGQKGCPGHHQRGASRPLGATPSRCRSPQPFEGLLARQGARILAAPGDAPARPSSPGQGRAPLCAPETRTRGWIRRALLVT